MGATRLEDAQQEKISIQNAFLLQKCTNFDTCPQTQLHFLGFSTQHMSDWIPTNWQKHLRPLGRTSFILLYPCGQSCPSQPLRYATTQPNLTGRSPANGFVQPPQSPKYTISSQKGCSQTLRKLPCLRLKYPRLLSASQLGGVERKRGIILRAKSQVQKGNFGVERKGQSSPKAMLWP